VPSLRTVVSLSRKKSVRNSSSVFARCCNLFWLCFRFRLL
jgi:hypothetical protein